MLAAALFTDHQSLVTTRIPLRHKHGETFAGAAGFDEFAHR
jgi:hypothetical protein